MTGDYAEATRDFQILIHVFLTRRRFRIDVCEDAEQALKKWGLEKPNPDEWGAFLKFLKEFCPCLELTCQPAGEQVVRYLQNVAHVRIYAGLKFDIDPKE